MYLRMTLRTRDFIFGKMRFWVMAQSKLLKRYLGKWLMKTLLVGLAKYTYLFLRGGRWRLYPTPSLEYANMCLCLLSGGLFPTRTPSTSNPPSSKAEARAVVIKALGG